MNPKTTARAEVQSQIAATRGPCLPYPSRSGSCSRGVHDLGPNDFRALLHMMLAEG